MNVRTLLSQAQPLPSASSFKYAKYKDYRSGVTGSDSTWEQVMRFFADGTLFVTDEWNCGGAVTERKAAGNYSFDEASKTVTYSTIQFENKEYNVFDKADPKIQKWTSDEVRDVTTGKLLFVLPGQLKQLQPCLSEDEGVTFVSEPLDQESIVPFLQ